MRLVPLSAFALVLACSSGTEEAEKLEPYVCGDIARLHTLNDVFLASQPGPQGFRDAKEAGIKTVVDLRLTEENRDFDEPALLAELGLTYHYLGFKTPDSLTDEVFDEVRALLNDPKKSPVMVHCASANRVGAVWLAHRVLDGGVAWEEALAEAKTVGLGSQAYEAKAQDYVARAKQDG